MTEALKLAAGPRAPSPEGATIPVRYAREAVAQLDLTEQQRARLLSDAGIAPGSLRRAGHRLTAAQFEAVYRRAIRAGADESLGYAAHRVPPGSYAFLVRSLTRCRDLAACLEQANGFYRLFDPAGGWELTVGCEVSTLRLRASTAAQAQSILFAHSMLLTPGRTSAWLVGQALPLAGLTLPERFRPFVAETRFLFGLAPELADGAAVRFATRQLSLPVIRAPRDVAGYLHASLRGFLLGAAGDPIEHKVRMILAAASPFAAVGVAEVGRRVGMSRQTLARHLQRIGTSFATLRDDLRRDYAIGLLGRGLRVADVSERLGYSEPSAFHRAFKGWTGAAPGRYLERRTEPG